MEIDEDAGTVTVETGLTFVKLMTILEERGWKIGIAPSGAMAGTMGAHVSRPGVGWGNVKYVNQGQQVLGLKVVLPLVRSSKRAPQPSRRRQLLPYALGPDLAGFSSARKALWVAVVEATLRIYPWPEKIYLERYIGTDLADAIDIFREIAHHNLVCYISVPVIKPDMILFDVNVEGDMSRWNISVERIRSIVAKYPSVRLRRTRCPAKFWNYRWFNTGEEFKDGIAGAVCYLLAL